jgi:branched-chain amino acid aminotransferase
MSDLLSLNGKIIHANDLHISPQNRAFRYGDGVFESIRIHKDTILWEDLHFRRLQKAAIQLHLKMMPGWSQEKFRTYLTELYAANHKANKAARVRLSLFRNDGGFYTPITDNASLLIESEPLNQDVYVLNATGLTLGVYDEIRKPFNALSGLKSINAQLYVLACIYKRDYGFDDVLLLNDEEMIAEATSSNVFIVKNNQLLTPALSQACVEGVMRAVVIELVGDIGISVKETKIAVADLEEADEVLLTNAIQGIRWVRQFRYKKYNNKFAIRLLEALKERTRG